MGKGDKKTGKGKRSMGSHGNTRPKKRSTSTAPSAQSEKPATAKKEAAVKKEPAAKKPAAKKAPAKTKTEE